MTTEKPKNESVNAKKLSSEEEKAIAAYSGQFGLGHEDSPAVSLPRLLIVSTQMRGFGEEDSVLHAVEPGKIWYTGNDTFVDSVDVVPCYYHEQYTEYADPSGRGAPCAINRGRPSNAVWDEGTNRLMLPNGHILKRTGVIYGVISGDDPGAWPFVIMLASTQYPKFVDWMRLMKRPIKSKSTGVVILPPWASSYTLGARREEDKKNHWFGWTIKQTIALLDPLKEPVTSALGMYTTVRDNYKRIEHERTVMAEDDISGLDDMPF